MTDFTDPVTDDLNLLGRLALLQAMQQHQAEELAAIHATIAETEARYTDARRTLHAWVVGALTGVAQTVTGFQARLGAAGEPEPTVRDVLATLHAEIAHQLHVAGAFAEPDEKE